MTVNKCLARKFEVKIDSIEQKVFDAMNERMKELERKLQTKARKYKAIDTKPLTEPLMVWDTLSVQEKHDIAAEMIEAVYISHNSNEVEDI